MSTFIGCCSGSYLAILDLSAESENPKVEVFHRESSDSIFKLSNTESSSLICQDIAKQLTDEDGRDPEYYIIASLKTMHAEHRDSAGRSCVIYGNQFFFNLRIGGHI